MAWSRTGRAAPARAPARRSSPQRAARGERAAPRAPRVARLPPAPVQIMRPLNSDLPMRPEDEPRRSGTAGRPRSPSASVARRRSCGGSWRGTRDPPRSAGTDKPAPENDAGEQNNRMPVDATPER